ncbi:MAG: SpoVG family protein [Deltaproteobacteria bacterium]|nr:SpoVG family protein [Deltaproteobacteria bacterium]
MEITDIRITLVHDDDRLKAFVIVCVNGIVIRDVKVIDDGKALFMSLPTKMLKNGNHRDIVYPANREGLRQLNQTVLKAYTEKLEAEAKSARDNQKEIVHA